MARIHNWNQMHAEYLASDIDEVAEFLRSKYSIDVVSNGGARMATLGWREEKEKILARVRGEVLAEHEAKLKERERQNLEVAGAMENLALISAHARLKDRLKVDASGRPAGTSLTAHELEKIFNMGRITQGKTTANATTNITGVNPEDIAKNILNREKEQEKLNEELTSEKSEDDL